MVSNTSYFDFWYWMVRASALCTLRQYEQAVAAYDLAIEFNPTSYRAWTKRGVLLKAFNREEEAIASFFQALEINPDYYLSRAWLHPWLIHEAFRAKYFKQDSNPALPEYLEQALLLQNRAIEIDSSSLNWLDKATLLEAMERNEEALNSYQRAIQINPNYSHAWTRKGRLLDKLQRYEEALTCLEKAIQLKPESKWSWDLRSQVLEHLQRHEEAIASYKKTAQLLEKSIPERVRLAPREYKQSSEICGYEEMGRLLEKADQDEEALAAYRRARSINPNESHWMYEQLLLKKLGRYEELVKLCDEWIEINPSEAIEVYAWVIRGEALYELQQWQAAIESYDRAIAFNPTHGSAIDGREKALKQINTEITNSII